MKTVERSAFKSDPCIKPIYQQILRAYQVRSHTKKVLLANRRIKDFCEESRHFAEIAGNPVMYIHFDVASWLDPSGILTRIERISIYDNFQEYQSCRLKALHGTKDSDGVCLN